MTKIATTDEALSEITDAMRTVVLAYALRAIEDYGENVRVSDLEDLDEHTIRVRIVAGDFTVATVDAIVGDGHVRIRGRWHGKRDPKNMN